MGRIETLVEALGGLNRYLLSLALVASTCGLIVVFAGYCWLHALVGGVAVGLDVALRWGMIGGLGAATLIAAGWSARRHIAAWAGASRFARAGMFGLLLVLIGGSAAVLHALATVPKPGTSMLESLPLLFFDAVPMAMCLAFFLVLVPLTAPSQLSVAATGEAKRPTVDWLTLPEMPNLRLRDRDVELVKSAGNYCELQANGRTYLVRVPMKVMEERLESRGFVRVHRTCLVNLRRIERVVPAPERRAPVIHLDTGELIPVGRTFRASIGAIGEAAGCH